MSSIPQHILLVRLGGIGDVICTLPAVEAIRAGFPDSLIGYAVEERAADLIVGHPAIDVAHVFQRRRLVNEFRAMHWFDVRAELHSYRQELRGMHYDLALDFQRNFKGAMHTLASGAHRKIGFTKPTAREFNHCFYREHIDPAPMMHWVDKFLAMAKVIGGKTEAAYYRLPDAPESRKRVEEFLKKNNLQEFVAIHPSASGFDPARQWEPKRFAQIAERVSKEMNLQIIVTWGPGERKLAEEIAKESNGYAIPCFETKSLLDLAELYRHAKIYIGLDTGPMHLATAVGLRSVVLFGSGNPAAYGPRSTGSMIVANYQNDHMEPMSSITVEQVLQAIKQVLSNSY